MLTTRFSTFLHRLHRTLRRTGLAYRFARGTLDRNTARDIVVLCEPIAGWYPPITLDSDDALALARPIYEDHPAIPRLIDQACATVASKWIDDMDANLAATRWAIDLIRDYAEAETVLLHDRPPD
jgi:hypothetical protein